MMVKFKLGRNRRKMLFMDEVSTSLLQLSSRTSDQCARAKVIGSTPVGRTREFFPSNLNGWLKDSLIDKHLSRVKITFRKTHKYSIRF